MLEHKLFVKAYIDNKYAMYIVYEIFMTYILISIPFNSLHK
jgi:hypothetical protein